MLGVEPTFCLLQRQMPVPGELTSRQKETWKRRKESNLNCDAGSEPAAQTTEPPSQQYFWSSQMESNHHALSGTGFFRPARLPLRHSSESFGTGYWT